MRLATLAQATLRQLKHQRVKDAALSTVTLLLGVGVLVGADFGIPIWIQVPAYCWLLTFGLPTTLTVIGLAAIWGRLEPMYGFNGFMLVTCLVAPAVHVLVMERLRAGKATTPDRVPLAKPVTVKPE